LIVVPRPASSSVQGQRCFDAAVFESGRPTLVIDEKLPLVIADHVMVAWNGSLEASRAVLGAMPLLHLADRVSIFAAPQYENEGVDAADLAESLSWHGIRAHQIRGLRDESSSGAALVSAAVEQQATMIVMGAYTHSRLRQSFLGGVTRHLLTHAPVPLLMSHCWRTRGNPSQPCVSWSEAWLLRSQRFKRVNWILLILTNINAYDILNAMIFQESAIF
jgi:nucleotide-binding universal stress UspA family protein